jgi:hypothetical protein
MLKYQTVSEGTLILCRCSTNGCLVWLLKFFFPVKVVHFTVLHQIKAVDKKSCSVWQWCKLLGLFCHFILPHIEIKTELALHMPVTDYVAAASSCKSVLC